MADPPTLGHDPRQPEQVVAELRAAFPAAYVEGAPSDRGTLLSIRTSNGSRLDIEVAYPAEIDATHDAVRQMFLNDALRDRVTDLLVSEMGGYAKTDCGNAPYILRWLVLVQHALVTIGDDRSVEPLLNSSSLAVLRAPSRRLKIWRDGAAVLHLDDARKGRGKSHGLDLNRLSLRDFQTTWLSSTGPTSSPVDLERLRATATSPSEAAATELLISYSDGTWLRHPRFAADVLPYHDGEAINWLEANHLSTVDTEATVQDRAVLAVACHLSGEVDPDVGLADALHFVGDARELVLDSMGAVAGAHPDPGGSWPTDCSPSCP